MAEGEKRGFSWPYFESLYFLADQMTPRETLGNIPLPETDSLLPKNDDHDEPDYPETENPDDDHADDLVQVLPSTSTAYQSKQPVEEQNPIPQTQRQKSSSKKRQSRPCKLANDVQHRMLAVEEEKLKNFKRRRMETDEQKDYGYHFLIGLLPHFKNVKPERKLHVQLQLQQVLLNEITSYSTLPSQAIFSNRSLPALCFVYYSSICTLTCFKSNHFI